MLIINYIPLKQRIPVAGEVEIKELSFKFNRGMTSTTSFSAGHVLIPNHLRHRSETEILAKIMEYFNSEIITAQYDWHCSKCQTSVEFSNGNDQ